MSNDSAKGGEVTKVEVKDLCVQYTIKHGTETTTYDIPRSFSSDEADATLLNYLQTLDAPAEVAQVDDWVTEPSDLTISKLQERVDAAQAEAAEKAEQADADAGAASEQTNADDSAAEEDK